MKYHKDYPVNRYSKPIEYIEAVQFDGSVVCADFVERWSEGVTSAIIDTETFPELVVWVMTADSFWKATKGDYIVKENGDFYTIKEHAFDEIYGGRKA